MTMLGLSDSNFEEVMRSEGYEHPLHCKHGGTSPASDESDQEPSDHEPPLHCSEGGPKNYGYATNKLGHQLCRSTTPC